MKTFLVAEKAARLEQLAARRFCMALEFKCKFRSMARCETNLMSGSIKGSLENVVKGKLVLKGGKGVGGGAAASSSLSKAAGVSKEVSEAPKLQSSGPKVYDTRTPYEKVLNPYTSPTRIICVHVRFAQTAPHFAASESRRSA